MTRPCRAHFARFTLIALFVSSFQAPLARAGDDHKQGGIFVGVPEVVTRERLVNDRLMQEEWLLEQLKAADKESFGFQGAMDLRTFFGVTAGVGINADKKELERYEIESQNFVEDQKRQQELAGLQHQIEILKLKEQIRQLEEGEDADKDGETADAAGETSSPPGATKPTRPSVSAGTAASSFATQLASADRGRLLPDPSKLTLADKVKGSPLDQFRDRLAYREEIRNELLENQLDDAHDLDGNTLYRLNFDVTVVPEGKKEDGWAVVEIMVEGATPGTVDLLEEWRKHLERELNEIVYERWLDGLGCLANQLAGASEVCQLSETYRRDLLVFAVRVGFSGKGPKRLSVSDYIAGLRRESTESRVDRVREFQDLIRALKEDSPGLDESDVLRLLIAENLVWELWNDADLGQFLLRPKVSPAPPIAQILIPIGSDDAEVAERGEHLWKELRKHRAYAYAATPKESVQRISEVAARRDALEISAAAAMLTGTASLDATLGLVQESQSLLQGISRPPLVVGFTEAPRPRTTVPPSGVADQETVARFGWLIGPKFQLKRSLLPWSKGFRFSHVPIQNSVAAAVSMPAWWKRAQVTVCTWWRGDDHDNEGLRSCDKGMAQTYLVRLPGSVSALTARFTEDRDPLIFSSKKYDVMAGERADILIEGLDLWRSTQVTMGGQRADQIRVLPNMRGLIATFNSVMERSSFAESAEPRRVPVLVWTSGGQASAGEATIHAGKPKTPPALKVNLSTRRLVKEGPMQLAIEQGTLPPGYSALEVGVRRRSPSTGDWESWKSAVAKVADGKFEAAFKATDFTSWQNGEEMQARAFVQLRPGPSDADLVAQSPTTGIYYGAESDTRITGPSTVQVATPKIELTFPMRAKIAFSGLSDSTAIKVTKAGAPVTLQNVQWKRDSEPWKLSFELSGVAAGEKVNLALDPAVPDLAFVNATVEVKP